MDTIKEVYTADELRPVTVSYVALKCGVDAIKILEMLSARFHLELSENGEDYIFPGRAYLEEMDALIKKFKGE